MKKLATLLIILLVAMPAMGFANGQGNPPKPGTQENPGLHWAGIYGFINSLGANVWGYAVAGYLWARGTPPWFVGK